MGKVKGFRLALTGVATVVLICLMLTNRYAIASPSLDAQLACYSKSSEVRAAHEADDLEHLTRLTAEAEKLCKAVSDPSMLAVFPRYRADLLFNAMDYEGSRNEYERCISTFYNDQFCHLGLGLALKALGRDTAAAQQVARTIKVIDHLIEEHDMEVAMIAHKGPRLAQLAKQERDLLVALRDQAKHQLDPPPPLTPFQSPSRRTEASPNHR